MKRFTKVDALEIQKWTLQWVEIDGTSKLDGPIWRPAFFDMSHSDKIACGAAIMLVQSMADSYMSDCMGKAFYCRLLG